ncbi:MAG TPA: 30S ribosomal protein S16 [Egibacteraceae bacterium]|nr:30S ribosomal protein S16 [Egibacteraceae bacterium]
MAVKMRLRREGKKKQPFYRVVVADVRAPRDGGFIDDIGYYQPLHDPSTISIDRERALKWLRDGAQPTSAVVNLLRIQGIWEEFRPGDPGKDRSAKHAARAAKVAEREAVARQQADDARRQREEAEAEQRAVAEREAAEQAAAEQKAADQAAAGEEPAAEQEPADGSAAGPDEAAARQAVEEVTQPAAQPAEDAGALPPTDDPGEGADGEQASDGGVATADESSREADVNQEEQP